VAFFARQTPNTHTHRADYVQAFARQPHGFHGFLYNCPLFVPIFVLRNSVNGNDIEERSRI